MSGVTSQIKQVSTMPIVDSLSFTEDKQRFFKEKPAISARAYALAEVNRQATTHSYSFLAKNIFSIEEEFRHLHSVLKQNADNNDEMWLYTYYCCVMLSAYYKENNYNSPAKCAEYLSIANQIEAFYTTGQFPKEKLVTWKEQLWGDLDDLLSTPWHLSKIRNWLGFTNIYRLAFTFSRLTTFEFYVTINKWFALLSNTLHMPLDLDKMNKQINGPTATFRALSVGLFLSRLLVNTSLVIKHTFFPTEGEKHLDMSSRFYLEMKKRYPQMLNDIVWTTINALTNYAEFFKISGPVANSLLITFLIFDVSLLAWRLKEAEQTHLIKQAQYTQERKAALLELEYLLKQSTIDHEKINALQKAIRCLDCQLEEQQIKQRTMRTNFNANIVAASLLTLGFSASLLFTIPALICASYLVIVIGTALYISADAYSAYEEKRIRQQRLTLLGESTASAKNETQEAWNSFVGKMIKNIVMPILIMGTLAICWQAAALLLVLFIASEYASKYKKADATYRQHMLFEKTAENPIVTNDTNVEQVTSKMLPA